MFEATWYRGPPRSLEIVELLRITFLKAKGDLKDADCEVCKEKPHSKDFEDDMTPAQRTRYMLDLMDAAAAQYSNGLRNVYHGACELVWHPTSGTSSVTPDTSTSSRSAASSEQQGTTFDVAESPQSQGLSEPSVGRGVDSTQQTTQFPSAPWLQQESESHGLDATGMFEMNARLYRRLIHAAAPFTNSWIPAHHLQHNAQPDTSTQQALSWDRAAASDLTHSYSSFFTTPQTVSPWSATPEQYTNVDVSQRCTYSPISDFDSQCRHCGVDLEFHEGDPWSTF